MNASSRCLFEAKKPMQATCRCIDGSSARLHTVKDHAADDVATFVRTRIRITMPFFLSRQILLVSSERSDGSCSLLPQKKHSSAENCVSNEELPSGNFQMFSGSVRALPNWNTY